MNPQATLENCYGCGAAPGRTHGKDCDWARCPECGEQFFLHEEHRPRRRPVWHGIDPRKEVAQELGWWTTCEGFTMEDFTRVQFAALLHQIRWNRETQRYEISRIDEAELDAAIRRSGGPW